MVKYIIMCGGDYKVWDIPRQMTKIRGEPIVARTIRLLRMCGVNNIAISTHDERFSRFDVQLLRHENGFGHKNGGVTGAWAEAFYPMNEPACYIMGDVVFSPEAIRTIVDTHTCGIQFFASCPPFSPMYTKKYAEPFAFKVFDQERFRAAIEYVKANVNTGIFTRHPIAWELWQVIRGRDVREIDYGSYVAINDYTCDIDNPEDVEKIERVLNWDT